MFIFSEYIYIYTYIQEYMCISIKKMKWNTIKIFQLKHSYHINKQTLSNTCNYKKGLYILINIFIKLATLTVLDTMYAYLQINVL